MSEAKAPILDNDDLSMLDIPAFLRRTKGVPMTEHVDEFGAPTPPEQKIVDGTDYKDGDKAQTSDGKVHECQKQMDELSLEEAQARLKQMTAQRDALITAISAYKKYVQKMIGQL